MTVKVIASLVFAFCTLIAILFQIALAAGAPWGEFAMGGRYPGRLPAPMRIAAIVQALVLAAFALIVLSSSGIVASSLQSFSATSIWAVTGFSAVASVLNMITPSRKERMVWAPITAIMLASSVTVALR